jgi:hypothetical protein
MEYAMRKLISAIAVGLFITGSVTIASPQSAVATSYQSKVVIVVGATQNATSSYRADADAAAAVFAKYTTNITKIYSPNATWAAVSAAARGANILVYMGHGSGFPNPYNQNLMPWGDNGMGLNTPTGGSDNVTQYYGENYMAQLALAPNAVVILNHLCFASGNNETGLGLPSIATAKTHVDGYASGFIRGGATAVIADGVHGIGPYIDGLFTAHTTIDALWKSSAVGYHGNLIAYPSSQNLGYTSQMDPDPAHPQSDGDYYYRSMVSIPALKTDDAISGQVPMYVSQSGTYHPLDTARVVDTRGFGIGPTGALSSDSKYTFAIAGKGNVPSGAIAITGNLTITSQTALGWVFMGPNIWGAPSSSTINFPVSDDRANGITVALSPAGTIDAWYHGSVAGATINIIIDVTGYYLAGTGGDGYVPYSPKRFVDTRIGTGLSGKFVSGQPKKIQIAGVSGLPASGIDAIVGNVTVVSPSMRGHMYLGPTADSNPSSSTINFPAGDNRANNFIVKVAPDGTIGAVYVGSGNVGNADVVVDISGYYTAGSGAQFHTLDPKRIMDTRIPLGVAGPIPAASAKPLTVWGTGGVPSGAVAITANLTVTQQQYGGVASVGPVIDLSSPFSNLNFPAGDNRANGVCVPLTSDGKVSFVLGPSTGAAHLLLDVNGYFQ